MTPVMFFTEGVDSRCNHSDIRSQQAESRCCAQAWRCLCGPGVQRACLGPPIPTGELPQCSSWHSMGQHSTLRAPCVLKYSERDSG